MSNAFFPNVPYHLIQSIRLVHALMESDYTIHIPFSHSDKFTKLKELFDIKYVVGVEGIPELSAFNINHCKPETSIGSIVRPLIFPHSLVHHCRNLWTETKNVRFSFAGLITENRKIVLDKWLKNLNLKSGFKNNNIINDSDSIMAQTDEILFWSSNRGRYFPVKSWDADYYSLLANSQFVVCPDGDYVWTYRFFEATLCGAIPIIENYCPSYEGFFFRTVEQEGTEFYWSKEQAEHNFVTCQHRITVSREEINSEVKKLLFS
jgi:hypothetical protein